MNQNDEKYLRLAIEHATKATLRGDQPFAAVLVKDDIAVMIKENEIFSQNDPTFHSETALIREFCMQNKILDLSEYTMYTNCEPCAMCAAAIVWAKVGRVVYALPTTRLNELNPGDKLPIESREIYSKAMQAPIVEGPLLIEEAEPIFKEFFQIK